MTRTSLIFAICLATLGAFAVLSSNGIAARGPVSVSDLAPADEYFGHLHLSPLGIRHTIFSLKYDLHRGRRKPDAIEHDALEVQDALQDWSVRYPRDSWIPAALWNLAVLYEELPGSDAQTHAIAVLQKLRDQYAGTDFAANAQRDLSRGIGVRPWPRWAGAPPPPGSPPAFGSPPALAWFKWRCRHVASARGRTGRCTFQDFDTISERVGDIEVASAFERNGVFNQRDSARRKALYELIVIRHTQSRVSFTRRRKICIDA